MTYCLPRCWKRLPISAPSVSNPYCSAPYGLAGLRSSPEVSLETQGTQALYGLCWSGLIQMIAEVLDQPVPRTAFRQFDNPQAAFVQVEHLSLADVLIPDEGGRLVVAFTGPRHLARLLRQVAGGLVGAGLATLPAPMGVDEEIWRSWIRYRAKSKPVIWPNHRPVIAAGLLDLGRSVVLVLPTGAGKTTVSELKIARDSCGWPQGNFPCPHPCSG